MEISPIILTIVFFFCSTFLTAAESSFRQNARTGTTYETKNGVSITRYSDGSFKQYIKSGSTTLVKEFNAKTGQTRYGTKSFGVTRYIDGGYEKSNALGDSSFRLTERDNLGNVRHGLETNTKGGSKTTYQGKGYSGSVSKYSSNYNGRSVSTESKISGTGKK